MGAVNKARPSRHASLYDRDFLEWTHEIAAKLRAGDFRDVDWENVAEEIESLGRSDRREVLSRVEVIMIHLLKSSIRRPTASWIATLNEQRRKLNLVLADSPSLRRQVPGSLDDAYRGARKNAAREMGVSEQRFPVECPFTVDQIAGDYFPE
jgi:hypothetical protein